MSTSWVKLACAATQADANPYQHGLNGLLTGYTSAVGEDYRSHLNDYSVQPPVAGALSTRPDPFECNVPGLVHDGRSVPLRCSKNYLRPAPLYLGAIACSPKFRERCRCRWSS